MPTDRHVVLVTGACGFSGRWLVRRLCDEGYIVRAGDVRAPPRAAAAKTKGEREAVEPLLDRRAVFVPCDVTQPAQVAAAVAGVRTVVQIGALVPYNLGRAYGRAALHAVNVEGTRTLVAAALAAGVANFLYASSTGVTFSGAAVSGGDETLPVPPVGGWNDPYSESKAVAEGLVLAASSTAPGRMACVALRPNGIWGPGEAHHVPKLLTMAQMGLSGFCFGASALTDFTHRDNLVHAFMLALGALEGVPWVPGKRSTVAGKAYFVTDGWPAHTLEFFSPLLRGLGFTPAFPSALIPRGSPAKGFQLQDGRAPVWPPVDCADHVFLPAARYPIGNTTGYVYIDEVVATGPPSLPLPGLVLAPAAALMEVAATLVRPLVNLEPFLTAADVRKVVRDNYYVYSAATRDLGYTPVTTPAQGLSECIDYYRAQGWRGRVPSAGLLPWLLAPPGLAVTCALGYDAGGALSAVLSAAPAGAVAAAAAALRWAFVACGMPAVSSGVAAAHCALSGVLGHVTTCSSPKAAALALSPVTDAATLAFALRAVFWGALACHVLQAGWVLVHAFRWRMAAGPLAVRSFLLGFANTRLVYKAARRPYEHIPALCIALFAACAGAAVLLHAAAAGLGFELL
jgi:nucleoside-diphosphate-sugar epimerase